MRSLLSLVCVAALFCCVCQAKGINQGKLPRTYPPSEWYYNHQTPANQMVPDSFNWCDLGNGTSYCTASWNQHEPRYCGSCWAHGSLSMIQDRLKGKKMQAGDITPDVMLGRQTLLNCAAFKGYGHGCYGGDTIDVFKYMAEEGLPDESCMHYQATDHSVFKQYSKGHKHCPAIAKCMNCMPTEDNGDGDDFKCWAVKEPVTYKLTAYGKLDAGEEAMKQEIHARGPIVCGIACPEEFIYKYHSAKNGGVYVDKSGDKELDHDVEVVGWGEEENGLKYWLVPNSWGSYWGSLGFFKLQRGVNALQIESGDCWYGVPEYEVETEVVNGELEGSMYGLEDHHHHDDDDDDDDDHPEVVIAEDNMVNDIDNSADAAEVLVHEIGELVSFAEGQAASVASSSWSSSLMGLSPRVGHACAHMRQAAGQAADQLWGMLAGAGASWAQPLQQQQQQQDVNGATAKAGKLAKRMFGVARTAEQ